MKSNWKVALIALGGVVAVALMCVFGVYSSQNKASGSNTITVVATDKAGKTTTVTRKVTLDTGAPVFEKVTLTPNPVDCGKTFVISVKVTD